MNPASTTRSEVTRLLKLWRSGDREALEQLIPLVYAHLRQLARRQMRAENRASISPTGLVHEAFLRLVQAEVEWQDRAHFYAVAARTMRRVLVDHAKANGRQKRGSGSAMLPLEDEMASTRPPGASLIDLNEALDRLEILDRKKAEIVDMIYFGGLTQAEVAEVLGLSESSVFRQVRLAEAWLRGQVRTAETPL